MASHNHQSTVIGTASGTLLSLLVTVHSEDVVKTTILASLGAVVSFLVSLSLKWLSAKFKRP